MPDKNRAVLFLSFDGLTDPLGQSQILPYMVGMSRVGYDVVIVSLEKPGRFGKHEQRIESTCAAEGIQWKPLRYSHWPPVISTVYNLYRMWTLVKRLQREHRFGIVHCRSYLASLIGVRMKIAYGVKFIFDMRGFWADERVEGGLWNLNNPIYARIYGFFKRREKKFLGEADLVVVLTQAARDYLVKNFSGVDEKKIVVIPCSVDLGHFDPKKISEEEKVRLRSALHIPHDSFVLIYLGSLGTWYLYKEMVQCFYQIKKIRPDAKFLFITPDASHVSLTDDFVVREATRDQVPLYCSIANASIFFIKPSFSKIASSATKMAEMLAMGIPVITNNHWGDVAFFKDTLHGFVVVDIDGDYTKAVRELLDDKASHAEIRGEAERHFSLATAIMRYGAIYQELT